MLIFLDTANVQIIQECLQLHILDGITTNPSSLAKEKDKPLNIIKQILHIFPQGIINVEITEIDNQKAYAQALKISELGSNVVVKIPAHAQYFSLINRLAEENIPTNITLVFSVMQAVLMGKLQATYISPFVGRLYEHNIDGLEVLKAIISSYKEYKFTTKILAASLRTVEQVNAAVTMGVDVITVGPTLFHAMITHQLTDQGMAKFALDWQAKDDKTFF